MQRSRAVVRVATVAAVVTVLVAAGAIWPASPIETLGAGGADGGVGATLHLPAAYTLLSPICELYDALTLLTLSQHAAILAWLVAILGALRIATRLRRRRGNVTQRGLHAEGLLLIALLLGFAAVYVIGALVPRPMAALAITDRDELAVDVHSHTAASHDGRPGFDAEANRRWHAAAGFAAAYITDHRHYDGAAAGGRRNPARAGDGTVLLPGIESAARHARINILGARASMRLDENGQADLARLETDTTVAVVLTTPVDLAQVPPSLRIDAVESSDGAPRGLFFTRSRAEEIGRFASGRGLARVAGSDNHGWGRTAAAWTVVRVPNWRAMSPDSLDSAIRAALLHDTGSFRVVARSATPLPRSVAALVATPALLAWSIARRLSLAERVTWLAWAWSAAGLALFASRRRRGSGAGPLPNDDAFGAARALRSPAPGRRVALRGR